MTMQEIQTTTDIKLLQLNDDPNEVRRSQMRMAMTALVKSGEGLLFYGNPADDAAEFLGLTERAEFNALASDHVITATGSDADLQTSIWLVYHHPDAITTLFPKNARGGVWHEDWGRQLVQTDDSIGGAKLPAVVDRYGWDLGLVVRDPRQVVRICNVDASDIADSGGAQVAADLDNVIFKMTEAMHHIFAPTMGTPAWYMGRSTALGMARIAQVMTTGNAFDYKQVAGVGPHMLHFGGIPVYISDQILNTEAVVA